MRLEFGVGVRADFAIEVDLFVLRCGPFHGWLLESWNVDAQEGYHGFRLKGKDVVGANNYKRNCGGWGFAELKKYKLKPWSTGGEEHTKEGTVVSDPLLPTIG